MCKILQARLQQYVNCELPDIQAGFRKGIGTGDQIANICWIVEKARSSRKTYISASLTMPSLLTVWITTDCGKFLKRWEYQITWPASWKFCMQVKKQELEMDMEQQTGSKLGKEYIKAVYCHPVGCSPTCSSLHEVFQARILEWVAIFLLQGIFLVQESNWGLLHCRWILYQLSYRGSLNALKNLCQKAKEAKKLSYYH